jgi:hypothetical protein
VQTASIEYGFPKVQFWPFLFQFRGVSLLTHKLCGFIEAKSLSYPLNVTKSIHYRC